MTWLNFITLNGVAPIEDLHLVSDAGAGKGLMQYHPTRDTELIACGKANTLLQGEYLPSPLLGNGSVTPAILVHGILTALQKKGFKIRLHCYQLGLDNMPDFVDSLVDDIVVHHCDIGQEKELMDSTLIPELERQLNHGEQHLIAESGIGGTTFATVWLKHWLGTTISLAGSTKEPSKLNKKEWVINQLLEKIATLPLSVDSFIQSNALSDPIQRATSAILNANLNEVNFAGGTMFFAPLIANSKQCHVSQVNISTTHWIMESQDAILASTYLSKNTKLMTPSVNFNRSRFNALRMYEQGYVVEGCGLGGTLVFAEQQGLSTGEIINAMDHVVAHWVE